MENIFNLYFNALNNSSIPYAITGCTTQYPEIIYSDIDIIIPNNQFKSFWAFMNQLQHKKIKWIQVISHEITAHYCIIVVSDENKHHLLKPDVCSDYYRKGVLFLKAEYLLKSRIFNSKGFYQLAPDKEFIYYLLKKVDKGDIDIVQFNHLLDQWGKNKGPCLEVSSLFFNKEHQLIIQRALDNNNLQYLKKNLAFLKKELHDNLSYSIKDFLLKGKNRVCRILQPTGLVIAFLGPDGSGKTTIINGVKLDLTEAFRKNKQFHFFPKEPIDSAPITNPHAKIQHGILISFIKLLYYIMLFFFGYWFKIYPLKVKSTLVIFDRYYHDLLVDSCRYRHGIGSYWTKFASKLIPKPDLWILLDAPADILQKRKSEVSLAETKRQALAYKKLFANLKNAFIVNANQKPETVIYDVEQIIIENLKNRTKNRYKKL